MDNDDNVQIIVACDEDSYKNNGALVVSSLETKDGWVMELVCFYHISTKEEYFETLKPEQSGVVILVSNKAYKIYGIDTVKIKMFDENEFLIYNVRYVLELKIFFISMFDDLCYCTRAGHEVLKVLHDEVGITKGSKICDLYI